MPLNNIFAFLMKQLDTKFIILTKSCWFYACVLLWRYEHIYKYVKEIAYNCKMYLFGVKRPGNNINHF